MRLFSTLYCFLASSADQRLFIILLSSSRCSSVAYISCLSASMSAWNCPNALSQGGVCYHSLYMHEFCSALQTTPVTENMKKYGLSMHDGGNLIWESPVRGFSWPLYLRLQSRRHECGKEVLVLRKPLEYRWETWTYIYVTDTDSVTCFCKSSYNNNILIYHNL